MGRKSHIQIPANINEVVLHSCCAPCSTAIIEWLLENNIRPLIHYYNPNIFPLEEYLERKEENKRYAEAKGLEFLDDDYDHKNWLNLTKEYRNEPERGKRCQLCFDMRLLKTAKIASEKGIHYFATTLATSRWKNLEQIKEAGEKAASHFPGVDFWAQNWRKGGLSERRSIIIKEYDFYEQEYCGCEFSLRDTNKWRISKGKKSIKR